jgi:hypothetical protein
MTYLYWFLTFVAFIALLFFCTRFLKWIKAHGIKINRWVWATAAFLVVIIPKALFPHLNSVISIILYVLCSVFALNFMIEQHEWLIKSKI